MYLLFFFFIFISLEVSQICCTCFWLFFVRKMTNICSEVVIFIFFSARKTWFKYQIPSYRGKKLPSLFKTHACLFFTFFLISEEMSQITDKSPIKIAVAPGFDYPLYVKQQMLKIVICKKKSLILKQLELVIIYQISTKEPCRLLLSVRWCTSLMLNNRGSLFSWVIRDFVVKFELSRLLLFLSKNEQNSPLMRF